MVMDVVKAIRNLRSEKNVKPDRRIPAVLVSEDHAAVLEHQADAIAALAGLNRENLTITKHLPEKPEDHVVLIVGTVEVYLPMAGMVDASEERARLEKDLAEAESQINRLEKLLESPFAEKAPEAVVQKERQKLADYRETAEKLRSQLNM
jgi:valyl-tRNA synthetase